MTALFIGGKNLSKKPLPYPPGKPITPSEIKRDRAYRAYAEAFAAWRAIDDPMSYFASTPAAEKAAMRAERYAKLVKLETAYLQAAANAERNAKRRSSGSVRMSKPAPQLRLFADAWPPSFDYIAERFPRRPRVTNDLELGTTIRPLNQAIAWRYIQHNPPTVDHLLIIDYDCADGEPVEMIWQKAGLPPPTWITRTPGTNRGHLVWALAKPVCTSDLAKYKPMAYLARIEQGYRQAINGDRGYSGFLTKNPISDDWDVSWINPNPYTLDELAQAVSIPRYTEFRKQKHLPPIEQTGLGRKVYTFDAVRMWAYTNVSDFWAAGADAWHSAVRAEVDAINAGFEVPLPDIHCKSIAKSIAKWVWKRFTPLTKHQYVMLTHTPEQQARRGRRKGNGKREAVMADAMARLAAGESLRAVAKALGVAPNTVRNWHRRSA